jgi:hypothetical protein
MPELGAVHISSALFLMSTYLIRVIESAVPPMLLATLVTAQHARPPQLLPLLFPPVFLFSAYLNVYGVKKDSAGITAAWSGLYLLLARRRKHPLMQKWGTRGIIRGATMGLCVANLLGGGFVYGTGKRSAEGKDIV